MINLTKKRTIEFLEGYALGKRYNKLAKTIDIFYEYSNRIKSCTDAERYMQHPATGCLQLISLGIENERTFITTILYYVLNYTDLTMSELSKFYNYDAEILSTLNYLMDKGVEIDIYYSRLIYSKTGTLIKLLDMCNVLFLDCLDYSEEKRLEIYNEISDYIVPLCDDYIKMIPEEQLVYETLKTEILESREHIGVSIKNK